MSADISRAADYGARTLLQPELRSLAVRLGRLAGSPRQVRDAETKADADARAYALGLDLAREIVHQEILSRRRSESARSAAEVADIFIPLFAGLKREQFHVLFLDPKNQIITSRMLFEGTVDSSAVYPREIFLEAYRLGATSLVFSHNHPSGDPEPSTCDRQITEALVRGATILQIKVLDHLIVAGKNYYSFADKGLISDYELAAIR